MIMDINNPIAPLQVEPSIYAIVLFDMEGQPRSQWLGMAYSFEGALDGAREKALKNFPDEAEDVVSWKPIIFSSLTMNDFRGMINDAIKTFGGKKKDLLSTQQIKKELLTTYPQYQEPKIQRLRKERKEQVSSEPAKPENQLMKKILRMKDLELLEKSRKKLNKHEFNYLVDRLAPNGDIKRKK